jgi:hypothetical protein
MQTTGWRIKYKTNLSHRNRRSSRTLKPLAFYRCMEDSEGTWNRSYCMAGVAAVAEIKK